MNKIYFLLIGLLCFNLQLNGGVEVVEGTIYFYPWAPTIVGRRDVHNVTQIFEDLGAYDRLGRAIISSGGQKDISEWREFSFLPKYFPIKFFHDENGDVIYDSVEISIKGKVFKLKLVHNEEVMNRYKISSSSYYLHRLMCFLRERTPEIPFD
jgi:hypothetical protein